MSSKTELIIQNGNQIILPGVQEGIVWETSRKGTPGKLTFTVAKDKALVFSEGNPVRFTYNGHKIFYGFVFTKKRNDLDFITVTCYDQLRYLKNKDTYVYKNKTASELLKKIAADYRLNVGNVENTTFKIKSRVDDNKELFNIIQNALDLTLDNTRKMYVLYDDFGSLALKNIESMKLDLLINESSGEAFEYTSSIDTNTYNKIKLSYENKDTGKREIYIAQDSSNINKWGLLQYFETIQEGVNGKVNANAMLALFNQKTRNLNMNRMFGDYRVRGGSSVIVDMNLGDITLLNYMVVDSVKHTFNENEHTMDIKLIGGEFVV